MMELRNRWLADPLYAEMRRRILDPELIPPGKETRSWWSKVPKIRHYVLDQDIFDFRCVNFDGLEVGKTWLASFCLDSASARRSQFDCTFFQDSSARNADFTGSHFIVPQMSRIYARGAIFKGCTFEGGFLQGSHSRLQKNHLGELIKGGFSDLQDCDFSNATLTRVVLEHCEFRGAKFSSARFVDCTFRLSDLRGVELADALFERCDFEKAEIEDTQQNRAALLLGNNTGLDAIVWCSPGDRTIQY